MKRVNFYNTIFKIMEKKENLKESLSTNSQEQKESDNQQSIFCTHIREFLSFERTTSSLTSGMMEVLSFSVVVHTWVGYLLLSEHAWSPSARALVDYLQTNQTLYQVISIFSYLLGFLMIFCLLGAKKKYKNRLWYSLVQKIVGSYMLLQKVLFLLSSHLLYVNLFQSIVLICISTLVSVIGNLLIQNFSIKKEENYQSSQHFSLTLKIGIIVIIIINISCYFTNSLTTFCVAATLGGMLVLLWFILGGCQIYLHRKPRTIILLWCGAMIANGVIFLLLIRPRREGATFSIFEWVITMFVVMFFLIQFQKKKRFTFLNPRKIVRSGNQLKNYDNNLNLLLEESDYDLEKENLLVGILYQGQVVLKKDQGSRIYDEIYDPQLKKIVSINSYVKEKESLVRYYLKWVYQKAIKQNQNNELLLDFAEFGISSLGDFSSHCRALESAQVGELSFLQRIRAYKLRLLLREQSEAFNRLILGGRIELDEAMTAQLTYQSIVKNIKTYCQESISFWNDTLQREIDMYSLRTKLLQNFERLPQITDGWNSISKFFAAQKHWRFVYLHFALFLKNQKIKRKFLSEETVSVPMIEESEISLLRSQQHIDDSIFFNKRSTLILCYLENGELIISRVSKSFQSITGYPPEEVQGIRLEKILPSSLKTDQNKPFSQWLEDGYSIREHQYHFSQSEFVNKFQAKIGCTVGFKIYIDLQESYSLRKFIVLLKSHQKLENSMQQEIDHKMIQNNESIPISMLERSGLEAEEGLKLNPNSNIFLKEQNMEPAQDISQIKRVRKVMRFNIVALIITLISFIFLLKNPSKEMREYSQGLLTFLTLYSRPFILGKYYFSAALMPFSTEMVLSMIQKNTAEFNSAKNNNLTNRFLYDDTINIPKMYPPFQETKLNQNIELSQVDTFFQIVSSITTMNKHPPTKTSYDFLQFNSYLMPGYNQIINTTKHQLHYKLLQTLQDTKNKQILKAVLVTLSLILIAVYVVYQMYHYFFNMKDVMETIIQFDNKRIRKIIDYWDHVSNLFSRLVYDEKQSQMRKPENIVLWNEQHIAQNKVSLNQKHKEIVVTTKQRWSHLKTFVIIGLLVLGFIPTILTIQIINIRNLNSMIQLEEAGIRYITGYPTESLLGYAMMNRYYCSLVPSEPYDQNRFRGILGVLKYLSYTNFYMQPNQNSLFLQKMQEYLNGNPCAVNPQLLVRSKVTYEQCMSIGGGSLGNGILNFFRHIQPTLDAYILQKITLNFFTELLDISIGLSLAQQFTFDGMKTWFSDFQEQINNFEKSNTVYSLVVIALALVLHLGIFEMIVMSNLKKHYDFMKKLYSSCVPESIILEQKIIKHRFYKSGILNIN